MARFVFEGKVYNVDDDKVDELKEELGIPTRHGKKVTLTQDIEKINGEEVKSKKEKKGKKKKEKEVIEEVNEEEVKEETSDIPQEEIKEEI